jgi:iron complex transport system ATP-binding protein
MALAPGLVHVLLGPNGAGKSTLMGLLAGAIDPDAGQVKFMGQPWAAWSLAAAARRRAWLPQHHHMPFDLRVEQVVALGRHAHVQRPHPQEAALVAECLRRAGAEPLSGRRYLQLSGGEQSRVQWARALAQLTPHPLDAGVTWLMLDEPTAALDLRHQSALMRVARDHASAGGGVVVVLHDLSLAARWADEVVVLQAGHVRAQGPLRDTLSPVLIEDVWGVKASWLQAPDERWGDGHAHLCVA